MKLFLQILKKNQSHRLHDTYQNFSNRQKATTKEVRKLEKMLDQLSISVSQSLSRAESQTQSRSITPEPEMEKL